MGLPKFGLGKKKPAADAATPPPIAPPPIPSVLGTTAETRAQDAGYLAVNAARRARTAAVGTAGRSTNVAPLTGTPNPNPRKKLVAQGLGVY